MDFLDPYQLEDVAAGLGNMGLVLLLLGWAAHFVWRGLRKQPARAAAANNRPTGCA